MKFKSIKILSAILVVVFTFNIITVSATDISNIQIIPNEVAANAQQEEEENNIETNVFAAQIDKNKEYKTQKLTLENIPDYMLSAIGIDSTEKSNKIIGLSEDDSENLSSFTVVNSDGTSTLHSFNEPVKYVDSETNEIRFIDNSIVPKYESLVSEKTEISKNVSEQGETSKKLIGFTNSANAVKVNMNADINDGVSLSYQEINVSLRPVIQSSSKATLKEMAFRSTEEQVVEYADVFGKGINLQYVPVNSGFKENIVLNSYTGVNTFDFVVDVGKYLPLYTEGEAIPFVDPDTEKIVFILGQVDARDSYVGNETDGHFTLYNSLSLKNIESGIYILTVTVDSEFLASDNTVYPVVVDPTVTVTSGNMQDTTVYSGTPNTQTYYSSAYNIVGHHGSSYGVGTAFIKATNMSSFSYILPGNVTSATYRVYEGSGKTNSVSVFARRPSYSWEQNTIKYNNMPHLNAVSHLTITKSGWKEFDITELARDWLAHANNALSMSQTYGFALEAKTGASQSLHFCSANNSNYAPSITITYRNAGYTVDVNATYSPNNDVGFKAFGYLLHGIAPMFKIRIATAGTYKIETLNSDTYFKTTFPMQNTRLALLDSNYNTLYSNDNISSSNQYSRITANLSAGTYYLQVYNDQGLKTNLKCYVIMALNGILSQNFDYYADTMEDFYYVGAATSTYNCLAYVLRDRTQWIGLEEMRNAAIEQLTVEKGCSINDVPTGNYIVLYGFGELARHVTIVENGIVKSKLSEHELVRHSKIEVYWADEGSFGHAIKYFSEP